MTGTCASRAFLAAEEHPTIVVEAGPSAAGSDGWRLCAVLTARGARVPVDLEVTLEAVDEGSAACGSPGDWIGPVWA